MKESGYRDHARCLDPGVSAHRRSSRCKYVRVQQRVCLAVRYAACAPYTYPWRKDPAPPGDGKLNFVADTFALFINVRSCCPRAKSTGYIQNFQNNDRTWQYAHYHDYSSFGMTAKAFLILVSSTAASCIASSCLSLGIVLSASCTTVMNPFPSTTCFNSGGSG